MRSLSMVLGLSFVGLLSIASAVSLPGCGKQTEGMRCDWDPDCEDGLTCTGVAAGKACCPQVGGAGACADRSAPTDAGSDETTTTTDGATDAQSDAATDGTADAAGDTGTTPDGATDSGSGDTGTTSSDAADAD